MEFVVIKNNPCGMKRHFYRFYLNDRLKLQLDVYAEQHRETKRHNYTTDALWSRLRKNDCTIPIKPVVAEDVIAEAVEQVKRAIEVEVT
jgi:hypothetical protein